MNINITQLHQELNKIKNTVSGIQEDYDYRSSGGNAKRSAMAKIQALINVIDPYKDYGYRKSGRIMVDISAREHELKVQKEKAAKLKEFRALSYTLGVITLGFVGLLILNVFDWWAVLIGIIIVASASVALFFAGKPDPIIEATISKTRNEKALFEHELQEALEREMNPNVTPLGDLQESSQPVES